MIPHKHRTLLIGLTLVAFIILGLVISISLSRFGEDDAGGSIVDYLGQSMLVFNAGIATRIESFAWGKYFFMNFLDLNKDIVWKDSLYGISTSNGSALNTFVGCFYVDFGPIITIIVALITSYILQSIFRSRRVDFADIYIFVFYLDFLYLGVFHCTAGFFLKIVLAIMLYIILKFMNRITVRRELLTF